MNLTARATRFISATPERVYDAWLDPERLGRWMFGPQTRDEVIVSLRTDPRVGGDYAFVVRRGENVVDHVGEYREIARPHRLVFTWGARETLPETSLVIVSIMAVPGGCVIDIAHELTPAWADFVERSSEAWAMMAGKLAEESS